MSLRFRITFRNNNLLALSQMIRLKKLFYNQHAYIVERDNNNIS